MGVIDCDTMMSAVGVVTRVTEGKSIVGSSKATVCHFAEVAEAWAVNEGAKLAIRQGRKRVVLETDPEPIFRSLKQKGVVLNWITAPILKISLVSRAANQCAHWVAQMNKRRWIPIDNWVSNIPSSLFCLLVKDSENVFADVEACLDVSSDTGWMKGYNFLAKKKNHREELMTPLSAHQKIIGYL